MIARRRRKAVSLCAAVAVLVLALAAVAWNASSGPAGQHPSAGGSPSPSISASNGRSGDTGGEEDPDLSGSRRDTGNTERPSGVTALEENPLYDTGRADPLPCRAPDLDVDDPDSMKRFLNAITDCLDRTWETQFHTAGLPFEPPDRVFWSEPGSSPCRDYPSDAGAFYCRANTSLYVGTSDIVRKWKGEDRSVIYATLLAHEYGHHVQGEAGMLDYYHDRRAQEPDATARNRWTRRSELQANCLAGTFLGVVGASYPLGDDDREAVLDDAAATADEEDAPEKDRTHGSPANSKRWLERGLEHRSPGACDTWGVGDSDRVD